MNTTVYVRFALILLVACKAKESTPASPAAGSAQTAVEKPAATPERKRDPAFVAVDRDQLKALCLATLLPRTQERPEYGALVLRDGSRVPWLAFSANESRERAMGGQPLLASVWSKQAAEVMADLNASETTGDSGVDTQLRLCGFGENAVVVSAVFVQQDGFHIVVSRGRKPVEKVLPPTASQDDAFTTAFQMIEAAVGQPATIAKHHMSPDSEGQLSVSDERWTAAATRASKM